MRKLLYVNKSPHSISYANNGDSGIDLRAWIEEGEMAFKPLERKLVHTGIYFQVPEDTEIQVRTKSGRALKNGLIVLNSPGTIDLEYTGEICVILCNLSDQNIVIYDGEKIAQAVVCPVYNSYHVQLEQVEDLNRNTNRGDGGFGSTGI